MAKLLDSTITGNLSVSANTTVTGNLIVSGINSASGNLFASGNVIVASNVSAAGGTISGNLVVTQNTTSGNIFATSNLFVGGTRLPNTAANTVDVLHQNASTIVISSKLNFINSATVNVVVSAGVAGNANISFIGSGVSPQISANGSAPLATGNINFVNTASVFATVSTGPNGNANVSFTASGGSASAGGSGNTVQFNSGGVLAGAANVFITSGNLELSANANLAPDIASLTPNSVGVFGQTYAGRPMMVMTTPGAHKVAVQPNFFKNQILYWFAAGNATTAVAAIGAAAPTAVAGTATARNIATTNFVTQTRRLGLVSAATAGANASWRGGTAQWFLSGIPGLGGFFAVFRFAISDAANVADQRMFVGFHTAVAGLTNANPSTLTNMIGVGCDSGNTNNLAIICRAGGGTTTYIDLGANFRANDSTKLYDFMLYADAGSANSNIGWTVQQVGTPNIAFGTLVAANNTPAQNTLLTPHLWRNNGATAAAVGLDMVSVYIETDT